jgi:hypothetical protein
MSKTYLKSDHFNGGGSPPEQIKKEIAALKADKTIPEAQKKQDLAELEAHPRSERLKSGQYARTAPRAATQPPRRAAS